MIVSSPEVGFLRKALRIIGPGRRRQLTGLALLAVVVALVEALTALLVFALIELLSDPTALPSLPMLGALGDRAGNVTATRTAFLWAAAAFFVVRGLLVGLQKYAQSRFGESMGRDVSVQLFRGYLEMPYEDHLGRNSSQLIRNALWSVNEVVINVLIPATAIFSEIVVVVALLITLLMASPLGVLVSVGVVAPIVFLTLRLVQPRLHRLGRRAEDETESAHRQFSQPLEGIRDVKILQKQGFFSGQFMVARAGLARARYLAATLQEAPRLTLETSVFLLVIGVLGVLQVGESAPLALLGIFGYAVVRLVPGVNRMVGAANRMRFGRAAIENVYRDLVLVAPSPASLDAVKDGLAPQDEVVFEKSIKLDNTSFSYVGASHPGVLAVDFEIAKGDFVGIVGPTGSGKTTLMDLIAGLLEPSSGSVLVDGRDIRLNLAGWQSKIGIVPQNVFLIDDTLRRNIALGIPDESIDGRALAETISAAQLGEFVESLDRGLDTVVGERGVRVSGGQRQRVAIARALYHRPELLLFDEGTAALDTLTEAALLQALEGLRGNYTMVSIAHRLASVRTCDLIVLMIDGRVVDLGSYDELLIRNPTFERMAR